MKGENLSELVSPKQLAALIRLEAAGTISHAAAKVVLSKMFENGLEKKATLEAFDRMIEENLTHLP